MMRLVSPGPIVLALLAAAAGTAAAAGAEEAEPVALPAPDPQGEAWTPLRFPGIDAPTRYEAATVDGRRVLRAESDCAASGLVLALADVDLARTPVLAWAWRVERPLPAAGEDVDERTRAGDDFAARVYVTFPEAPEEEPWHVRLRRSLLERVYGARIPRCALCYVWARSEAPGAEWPSPYAPQTRLRVLRSGEAAGDGWRHERVDVAADYRRIFGAPPPRPSGIAVMTDSDDTCTGARALFADLRFVPRGAATP